MDGVTAYALSKKVAASAVSGVKSMSVDGQTLTINTNDSGVLKMVFPTPSDGRSVTDIDVNDKNQIVFTMSDGTEITSGVIPTVIGADGKPGKDGKAFTYDDFTEEQLEALKVKGDKGDTGKDAVSPTITENENNTNKIYKLDVTTADGTFTTPNLKGKDGSGSSTGEENIIESIKVNGVAQTVAEDKSVDITVPTVDVDKNYVDTELVKKANTSDIPSLDGYVTDEELTAKGYLTSHQDINGKVDKVKGKSLIADTEIERLKSVKNYDDTEIKTELAKKANSADVTKEISDKIAEVVSDAPESFNTLKEISDWISGHENDASAMNSTIKDNKSAITILQTDKADKTEIPTELPANGGNADTVGEHTVKSDVPENAVFTDTVYDDAEVQKRISDNGYGEVAGGKNLVKSYKSTETAEQYNTALLADINLKSSTTYTISFIAAKDHLIYGNEYIFDNPGGITCTGERQSFTMTTLSAPSGLDSQFKIIFKNVTGNTVIPNFTDVQIEEGTTATSYEPYFPSNKMLEEEKADKSEITVNLLNPTLQTTTRNGVTCTNNGDGTYTLNGTASDSTVFVFQNTANIIKENANKTLRFVSKGDTLETYYTQAYFNNTVPAKDLGSGINFKVPTNVSETNVAVVIKSGAVLPNIIIKPMLTTNLDATYDDFVPYTGDTGRLNGDVASLLKRIEILESLVNKADTTVTE